MDVKIKFRGQPAKEALVETSVEILLAAILEELKLLNENIEALRSKKGK